MLPKIERRIHHELMEALAALLGDRERARAAIARRGLVLRRHDGDQSGLLQSRQDRIHGAAAELGPRTDLVVGDLRDEIAMHARAHQQRQTDQLVHAAPQWLCYIPSAY